MPQADLLEKLAQAVIQLDRAEAENFAQQALAAGLRPYHILAEGLSRGMQTVGEKFKCAEMFIPEVMVACDAYYAGLQVIRPHLAADDRDRFLGTMVLGTIHGDIHTVGKDVALPIFEAAGFHVIDLGVAVPPETFVQAIREHHPQLVGLGTYMTSTFMHTREVVQAITDAGLREQVKIICGGPSVDVRAARDMGADDASDNAWEAVGKMKALLAPGAEEKKP